MNAALEEERVRAHALAVFGPRRAPGQQFMDGMGGRIGGRMRACLQIECDLAPQHVGAADRAGPRCAAAQSGRRAADHLRRSHRY